MATTFATAMRRLTTAAFAFTAMAAPALADKRVALVIGNGAYANAPRLDNPGRDADAVANALRGAGFASVTVERNLGRDALLSALRRFEATSDDADWSLVYFAGHGMEISGTNYLLPIDAKLRSDRDIDEEAVSLPQVQKRLEGAKRLRLVILDACRDNPFAAAMKRSGATRSVTRGLAVPDAPRTGSLVAFSADVGQVAADAVAEGGNSPYAAALVKNLAEPDVEVNLFFRRVRFDVLNATGQKQAPATYEALPVDRLVFRPGLATPPVVASPPSPAMDEIAWRYVNRDNAASLKQFLSDYPASAFASEARSKVAALEAPKPAPPPAVAAIAPVDTPQLQPVGILLSILSDEMRTKFGIKDSVKTGVVLTEVYPNMVAAERNLKAGETIVEVAQEPVRTPTDVVNKFRSLTAAGKKVALLLVADAQGDIRFVALPLDASLPVAAPAQPQVQPQPQSQSQSITSDNPDILMCSNALALNRRRWDVAPLLARTVAEAKERYSIDDCRVLLGLKPLGTLATRKRS